MGLRSSVEKWFARGFIALFLEQNKQWTRNKTENPG